MENLDYPEIDENGRRFRRVGEHCKEYAPVLIVHEPAPAEPIPQKLKACPFQSGLYPQCKEDDCAFFKGGKCKPGTATAGKRCPLPAHLTCGNTCTMYKNRRCGLFPQQKGTKK